MVIIGKGEFGLTLHAPDTAREHGVEHRIDVVAGPFSGTFVVDAYENPYQQIAGGLENLYASLSGEVVPHQFENMMLKFIGDGRGHINVPVRIMLREKGIELKFAIEVDQTELPAIIMSIRETFLAS